MTLAHVVQALSGLLGILLGATIATGIFAWGYKDTFFKRITVYFGLASVVIAALIFILFSRS